ncbi:MAG TPA: methyltransferase domain-containing protein [Candidatus Udaeobacter sp.]|nr:methyltransferase domain-containing protein [Candidatus Udaeobacter sp.]
MLSFIGQFLPLFLQFGLSAAKETVHIAASTIESKIFGYFVIGLSLIAIKALMRAKNERMGEQRTDSNDSSPPEFWDVRYTAGETPWDFHGVPAELKAFLKTSQPGSVLIPGCGTGYEVRAFHEAGWKVTAIDFSPVATERARASLGGLASRVIHGDFFTHDFGSRYFDVIYERTFLCALPPDLWPAYVERMTQLLRPGGKLVGIFLYGEEHDPPPYPLSLEKVRELFRKNFPS